MKETDLWNHKDTNSDSSIANSDRFNQEPSFQKAGSSN